MDNERVNKRIFLWSQHTRQKCVHVGKILQKSNTILNVESSFSKSQMQVITKNIQDTLFTEYKVGWKSKVDSNTSVSKNNGRKKLRTYKYL